MLTWRGRGLVITVPRLALLSRLRRSRAGGDVRTRLPAVPPGPLRPQHILIHKLLCPFLEEQHKGSTTSEEGTKSNTLTHTDPHKPGAGNSFHRTVPSWCGSPCSSSCKHWELHERLHGKHTVGCDAEKRNEKKKMLFGVVVATACAFKTILKIEQAITVKETVVFEASSAEECVEGVQRLLSLHRLSERPV